MKISIVNPESSVEAGSTINLRTGEAAYHLQVGFRGQLLVVVPITREQYEGLFEPGGDDPPPQPLVDGTLADFLTETASSTLPEAQASRMFDENDDPDPRSGGTGRSLLDQIHYGAASEGVGKEATRHDAAGGSSPAGSGGPTELQGSDL